MLTANRLTRLFVLALLACLPLSSVAQTAAEENGNLADHIAEHLAIVHQLSEIPHDIRLQFEQNPLQLPSETNKKMLDYFRDAYADSALLEDFKQILDTNINGSGADGIKDWLARDNTTAITEMRQAFYTLQGKRQRIITMYEMDQNPPVDERVQLVKSLTDTTAVVESTIESSVIVLRSVIEALSELSTQQSFTPPQVNAIANNFRSQIEGQIAQEYNNRMVVLFHNASDTTLRDYIAFWGTETGRQLDQYISQSIEEAYRRASDRFLQSVKRD